jgi:hypothetical protein
MVTNTPQSDLNRLPADTDQRSLGDLIRDLRDQSVELLKKEFDLAKTEMSQKLTKLALDAVNIAVGGLIAYAGVIALLIALSYGLMVLLQKAGMPAAHAFWVSPLIVGLLCLGGGGFLAYRAISKLKNQSVTPEKTIQSMQENKQWLQQKIS